MNPLDLPRTATQLQQVYLVERDAGLLCRILGLYAARGLDVAHVDYAYAATEVMKINVSVERSGADADDVVRVLVEKAGTLVGVLAACEQVPPQRHPA